MDNLMLDEKFFLEHWRMKPIYFQGKAKSLAGAKNWETEFLNWCVKSSSGRIFAWALGEASKAATVDNIESLIFTSNEINSSNIPLTVLLNEVDLKDELLCHLHDAFGVCQDWRRGDIVATLSGLHSGIGFHAGNEDGFIIQLNGTRNWKLWSSDIISKNYRNYLLGDPEEAEQVALPPSILPLYEYHLEPGDILYIPPLWPHEGKTLERSVSLSVAWKGITLGTLFRALSHSDPKYLKYLDNFNEDSLNKLFEDPPKGNVIFQRNCIEDKLNKITSQWQ